MLRVVLLCCCAVVRRCLCVFIGVSLEPQRSISPREKVWWSPHLFIYNHRQISEIAITATIITTTSIITTTTTTIITTTITTITMSGLAYLGVVVVSWVMSSFVTGRVMDVYQKPFLMTYINMSSLVLYLPLYFIWTPSHSPKDCDEESCLMEKHTYGTILQEPATNNNGRLILLTFLFAILWFLANFFTNSSLAYTSVASQTILSSTSSFFTMAIGALVGIELFTGRKLLGLFSSFIGVYLVTMSDFQLPSASTGRSFIGDGLALAGALVYGGYTTLFKSRERLVQKYNMNLVFGLIGLFTLCTCWPLYFVYNKYIQQEPLELPPTSAIYMLILFNCALSFISNFCWAKAVMTLKSPLVVTTGLTMSIPLAMLSDVLFNSQPFSWRYLVGAFYIVQGFIIIDGFSK